MQRQFSSRKTISVHVEEDEYKWIVLQAEGSISAWARERILESMPRESVAGQLNQGEVKVRFSNGAEPRKIPTVAELALSVTDEVVLRAAKLSVEPEMPKPARKHKTCVHGIVKDHYCGMCQGKAVVE